MLEKSSPELTALFADLAPKAPSVTQKQMFGWPCCFVNGNLFTGLHKQSIIFRLSDDDRAAILKLHGTADFEPMPGRKMKGYVILADPLRRDRVELRRWIESALKHTQALPPKARRAKKQSTKKNVKESSGRKGR